MAELRHQHLRRLYRARGMTIEELALATRQSRNTVSFKLSGVYPWTIDDIYALCDLLQIEWKDIPHYFPRHGMDRYAPPLIGRIATERDDAAQRLVDAFQDIFEQFMVRD